MNGVLPILAGAALLIMGGVAAIRSTGGQVADRRQLENRLKELQVQDRNGGPAVAASALPADIPRWLGIMLARADIVPRMEPALLLLVIFAVVSLSFLLLLGWLAAAVVMMIEVAGGFLALRIVAQRRIAGFVDGLPFFLDTVRQMLTTGSSVQTALIRATENAGPGMQRYLQPMVRRIQNGAAVGDSATWLAERLNVLELHMFATAIQTNVRYGGRLSLVLANLIAVLRDRARVIRELKAATAETRMSAIILGALPVVAGTFITLSNPSYTRFFFATTQGHHLLSAALVLQILGMLAMRWLMCLDY
jgi:tight adherence protein B